MEIPVENGALHSTLGCLSCVPYFQCMRASVAAPEEINIANNGAAPYLTDEQAVI